MKRDEIEGVLAAADIRELAGSCMELRRESNREMSGPCPKCGGSDRFHCQASWFFCRQCHPERGDAIEFLRWLHGCGFKEACEMLGARAPIEPLKRRSDVSVMRLDAKWRSPRWQEDARRKMEAAIFRLSTPDGEKGQEYLLSRGLTPDTWRAWKLGYEPDHVQREKVDGTWIEESLGPAITLPWTDGKRVKALQYRLFSHPTMRYRQKTGGDRTLFGAHLITRRNILIICEGEINACSLWQAGHEHIDVVSFGSQSNLKHAGAYLRKLAGRYDYVLVWMDKGDKAVEAVEVLGCRATPVKSPRGKDANDLLQEGVLADVLARMIAAVCGQHPELPSPGRDSIQLVYPVGAPAVTIHGQWRRLEDGRIEAEYSRAELIWAMIAVGYEPTAEEMVVAATA